MYTDYYHLDTDPFRLTTDLQFLYPHRGYLDALDSMRYALHQGDGMLLLTGRPGTGKTLLIESFVAELHSEDILVATVVSTHLREDELLRMVAYEFGLQPSHRDKATLLHELKVLLSRWDRALLIIDEAQNLSAVALEEMRMLTNLTLGTRSLLQVFFVGQESLHEQLREPAMEQLYQRLTATSTLQPLDLQTSCDYVRHRLASAGWCGEPVLTAELFVLIHRFSRGLPRYISAFCSRLFQYGSTERCHQLSVDDAVVVIAMLEQEMLVPLNMGQAYGGAEPLPNIQDLVATQGVPLSVKLSLSAEEAAFLSGNPALIQPMPARPMPARDAVDRVTRSASRPGWRAGWAGSTGRHAGARALGIATVLLAVLIGTYRVVAGYGDPNVKTETSRPRVELPVPTADPGPEIPPAASEPPVVTLTAPPGVPTSVPTPTAREILSTAAPSASESLSMPSFPRSGTVVATASSAAGASIPPEARETPAGATAGDRNDLGEPAAVAASGREQRIEELLQLAALAIESDNLRVPDSANAWRYYQQVFALDPDNPAAEEGLRRIAARYTQLVRFQLDDQNYGKADLFIERGLGVQDGHPELLSLRQEVTARRLALELSAAEAEAARRISAQTSR